MEYLAAKLDIGIIGAGHAGVEAALAAARLGASTVLFTLSLDAIANLPCNPSIGGTAKGHLVREIDALGGEMGKVADATFLQSRMLNRGKGAAVHSLRVQTDRTAYHSAMKEILENQPNLDIKQAEIVALRKGPDGWELVTALGAMYLVQAVIIATGTYLRGKVFVGEYSAPSGPDGMHAATALTTSLAELGLPLRRFKTGTPARVHKDSIDFTKLSAQPGDDVIEPFSLETTGQLHNKVLCHIAYTNESTHKVIEANLHRSPLYGGKIEGIGPRYCPSIEDKVVRFADKSRHQLFIEPMGLHTKEMYLQGMSSSLPEEVQVALYRTIEGLENVKIMRNAYAIEYDCIDATILYPTLECKTAPGLYGAGQFNGTSGYEEAAAQGLIAGINAVHKLQGKPPVILGRDQAYIGTLIDDLVTKGCQDPYRMMTSRSEYRLLLRQDNAADRLTPLGHQIGLITPTRYQHFLDTKRGKDQEIARLMALTLAPSPQLNAMLEAKGTAPLQTGAKAAELLRRPQITYTHLTPFDPAQPKNLTPRQLHQVETEIKYEGYIKKQMQQVEAFSKLENALLPEGLDYASISGLRLEAQEKLGKIKPLSLGQASRISGVSPADITVLVIYLKAKEKGGDSHATAHTAN